MKCFYVALCMLLGIYSVNSYAKELGPANRDSLTNAGFTLYI
jgi:hypothetical protein